MIVFVRTTVAMPGKFTELVAFAKEIAKFIKQASGADVSVSTSIGGSATAVAWTSMAESLAEWEKGGATLMANPEYHALLKKAEGLIVPGSTQDQLWRHI
jgi:hypothetical protein